MPLYEYQCEACGHRFEVIQKFSDALVEKCPVCGGAVRKLQSAPAFQFRGSGWYVTDYGKKDQTPAAKSETSPPAGDKTDKPSEKSTETKSDSKTETKTDTKTSS